MSVVGPRFYKRKREVRNVEESEDEISAAETQTFQNGTAPLASLRLASLATRDNALVMIALAIAADYFGLVNTVATVLPC